MNNESLITESQAYAAMYFFLESLYNIGPNSPLGEELGGLLGSMSWLQDEKPIDGTFEGEWRQAVTKALSGEKPFLKLS